MMAGQSIANPAVSDDPKEVAFKIYFISCLCPSGNPKNLKLLFSPPFDLLLQEPYCLVFEHNPCHMPT